MATLGAVAVAVLLSFLLDPQLRRITPGDYPVDGHAWLGMSLFALGFVPLFLCFAPYAFFIRLSRKQDAALVLTVLFGVFILALKLSSAKTPTPMGRILTLSPDREPSRLAAALPPNTRTNARAPSAFMAAASRDDSRSVAQAFQPAGSGDFPVPGSEQ